MMMNPRNIVALKSSGRDCNRVVTSTLMLEIALMLFSGRSTLRILRDFRFTLVATRSTILKHE